jgi:hypothetical protein
MVVLIGLIWLMQLCQAQQPAPQATPTPSNSRRPRPTYTPANKDGNAPPDVLLHVPELSVGRIELDVDNLRANINLNANIANLVKINAGVAVSVKKVNITIADVNAKLDLEVRLGNLVDIVHRVFESLDLNPLLIGVINNVTSLLDTTVGAVDNLLGSITRGDTNLSFLVDGLGNIVQKVAGKAGEITQSIVGNYQNNMTYTGKQQSLQGGLTKKTYEYSPLNALVDIITNTLGEVVDAKVVKKEPASGGGQPNSGKRVVQNMPEQSALQEEQPDASGNQ